MKKILLIILVFLIYSLSMVFLKLTSQEEFMGINYMFFFACVIITMLLYAILWQKVLTYMPLNKLFLCKSSTILIILAVSSFIFDEKINLNNILGSILILSGLITLAWKK